MRGATGSENESGAPSWINWNGSAQPGFSPRLARGRGSGAHSTPDSTALMM
jgi:hypothetical protein